MGPWMIQYLNNLNLSEESALITTLKELFSTVSPQVVISLSYQVDLNHAFLQGIKSTAALRQELANVLPDCKIAKDFLEEKQQDAHEVCVCLLTTSADNYIFSSCASCQRASELCWRTVRRRGESSSTTPFFRGALTSNVTHAVVQRTAGSNKKIVSSFQL